jgi:hypothetical protein
MLMRSTLVLLLLGSSGIGHGQYWGVLMGTEHATINGIVVNENVDEPARPSTQAWYAGACWAPEDSAIHFRLQVCWEEQGWKQYFTGRSEHRNGVTTYRRGTMERRMGIVRLAPQVVFPLGKRTRLVAGLGLGIVAATRTVESAIVVRVWGWHSPSAPSGASWTPSDTSYTGTEGLRPYLSVEMGLERTLWRWLGISAGCGINSTYAALSPSGNTGVPPLCARFGLLVCLK